MNTFVENVHPEELENNDYNGCPAGHPCSECPDRNICEDSDSADECFTPER